MYEKNIHVFISSCNLKDVLLRIICESFKQLNDSNLYYNYLKKKMMN